MKALEPAMMRLMLHGALGLAGGALLLLLVDGGWLGAHDGLAVRAALIGAILSNAYGAFCFARYSLAFAKDWLDRHRR